MTITENRNALPPGYRLHWYEILSVLGQGGFGITYLARDHNLGVEVAIKEYLPVQFAVREADSSLHPVSGEKAEQFAWGLERFLSEARTLAQFRHPNLVRVSSVFTENNSAYMVMDYERGDELKVLLDDRNTLTEEELLDVVLPLLDALAVVHQAGFIHRDIKPANILIRPDGSPVLIDFGSARQALGAETQTLTSVVSAGYAPYEQYANDSKQQGAWTDIYGLGATLYRAISGTEPANALERGTKLLINEADPLLPGDKVAQGSYSNHFLAAIDHALGFNRKQRPRTLAQWRNELKGVGVDQVGTGALPQPALAPEAEIAPNGKSPADLSQSDDERETKLFRASSSPAEPKVATAIKKQPVLAVKRKPRGRLLKLIWLILLCEVIGGGYLFWQQNFRMTPLDSLAGNDQMLGSIKRVRSLDQVKSAQLKPADQLMQESTRQVERQRVSELEVAEFAPVATGQLQVSVNQPTELILDGELVGLASDRLPWRSEGIVAGTHQLELKAAGFISLAIDVEVKPAQWNYMNLQLQPLLNSRSLTQSQVESESFMRTSPPEYGGRPLPLRPPPLDGGDRHRPPPRR